MPLALFVLTGPVCPLLAELTVCVTHGRWRDDGKTHLKNIIIFAIPFGEASSAEMTNFTFKSTGQGSTMHFLYCVEVKVWLC